MDRDRVKVLLKLLEQGSRGPLFAGRVRRKKRAEGNLVISNNLSEDEWDFEACNLLTVNDHQYDTKDECDLQATFELMRLEEEAHSNDSEDEWDLQESIVE
ncbi:hypothetical protein F0562_033137 [Nyssa sinensis]|uniref:Uncharacterized protein n=1 Tax=Nyssa sinensis TaxID=561372 RepID=A0A5J5AWE5_9ASTE|nr:hypothetical protein F0562_033137 [Nyssa sinensis]